MLFCLVEKYAFTGAPKTEILAAVEEKEKEDGTTEPASPAYLEVDHLSFVVKEVDDSTAVVPKGAFVVDPAFNVVENPMFGGLTLADCYSDSSFYHLRKPITEATARDQDGHVKAIDFLDKISTTHPQGAWSIFIDPSKSTVTLRSLLFPGYSFFHDIGTKSFGGAYFGDGKKNTDIAFML